MALGSSLSIKESLQEAHISNSWESILPPPVRKGEGINLLKKETPCGEIRVRVKSLKSFNGRFAESETEPTRLKEFRQFKKDTFKKDTRGPEQYPIVSVDAASEDQ
jgi:hypothetical protein